MRLKNTNKHRYRFQWCLMHPRHWTTWLGLAVLFIITLLPSSLIDGLGCRLGKVVANRNKKRFNIAKTNLTLCFPEKSNDEIEHMARQHFQAQFRSLLHYPVLWWSPESVVRKRIQTAGFEQIADYRKQGKNVIVLLTHNVGLDFASAAISMAYPANGPYKKIRNPVIDWLIANARLRFTDKHGGQLFTREDGLRPLIRGTRAGKVLIYLGDEDLGEAHSIFADFFGVKKATLPLLGRLAKSCDAVVLPCVSCYQPEHRTYLVKLLPKIENMPGSSDEADSLNMNKAIESAIAQCPIQYLWTLRYFQTRPPGEVSVYG
ncbi:MAG: lipid A biosynthesis acyltransferase [Gammaproteobacteria bacterium]|nr:lipid A biosynthesis acyltransferase [Gammaproteobacteria bacterium]